ncbi:AAA family ATPase [Agromyces hippuratus]|uniref:AAA family ATPase n=1 Tax=Agromyces hippuratus TaxID=286438 RepID=UPI0015CCFB05
MNPIDNIQPSLLGRGEELERLAVLVGSARNGHGSALLLRGEAGIGKTTLLEAAMHDLAGVRVVRSDGFEAESAMPYAMLQRLGTPFTHLVPALPRRQASALRIAAGVDEGPPPDRYLVGLGMLSLLAAAAEREPLVCVVDDAHLSDPESLEVLAFVARRLKAEAVAIVLSTRPDPRVDRAAAGIASLELGGLDAQTAVHVLNRSATDQVDPYLAMRFAEETGGNPLALTDLAREFTAQQLTDSSLGLGPFRSVNAWSPPTFARSKRFRPTRVGGSASSRRSPPVIPRSSTKPLAGSPCPPMPPGRPRAPGSPLRATACSSGIRSSALPSTTRCQRRSVAACTRRSNRSPEHVVVPISRSGTRQRPRSASTTRSPTASNWQRMPRAGVAARSHVLDCWRARPICRAMGRSGRRGSSPPPRPPRSPVRHASRPRCSTESTRPPSTPWPRGGCSCCAPCSPCSWPIPKG